MCGVGSMVEIVTIIGYIGWFCVLCAGIIAIKTVLGGDDE